MRAVVIWLILAGLVSSVALARSPKDDDDEQEPKMSPAASPRMYNFSDLSVDGELVAPAAASFGATPGGAQDIRFFRDRVAAGEIPHPNVFTAEGLFSEHDLPLNEQTAPCTQLLCVRGEATAASFLTQPSVRTLAQIGFSSGLNPTTWKRAPLNLVAVVDKSGSMAGQPLETVKKSLSKVAELLSDQDQLAIVLYGDRSHVHLAPTKGSHKQRLFDAISSIESAGSTAMEEGLRTGFELARTTGKSFSGTTRVMLFTDERPNVGATDANSFMGMAETNSRAGIGMTTIGVGVQFGAELATKISSVRGGNLFFFANVPQMETAFSEEFDTMVTELAWDLVFEVHPAPGMKISGLYGLPGDLVEWTPNGGLKLVVSTIFLSRKKGAIYVAFEPATTDGLPRPSPVAGDRVGTVTLAYQEANGPLRSDRFELPWVSPNQASVGLRRGVALINQALATRESARLHHEQNDQENAWRMVRDVLAVLKQTGDAELDNEVLLVSQLETTLALLSGHKGEGSAGQTSSTTRPPAVIDRHTGLPVR
ncbi:MAG: VWA domain-containing protein [Myxococcales bacterium]|nr:VWA domain-containing protein [Myxococcales bacterium]